ncbi:MAG: phosphoribosylamine--glycine ligase [Candidatus Daviesbacteria bacterium]|nr:phosphoribosylamine--glycine ligase [Candidatus Daviesbacteria bacterium]
MKKLVVLISNKGSGTNLQAIIDGISFGKINAKIISVISDTDNAYGLIRAKKANISFKTIKKRDNLIKLLQNLGVDYICLAGWKQIIPDKMIRTFPNKILNIHPGLIPDSLDGVVKNPDGTDGLWNRGKFTQKAIQNFLDSKATYAGSSVNFLSHEFDFGQVLGRCFERIKKVDTVESLYVRLKKKENKLYDDVLVRLCQENGKTIMVIDGGGRGAVLVDKYGQSKYVGRILVVPGNDLMQINTNKKVMIYPNLKTTSTKEILEICKREKVDLVDVAQDNAVEAGLVNKLTKIGIPSVGSTKDAGQIEWDKAWARKFMKKYQIPSPVFYKFDNEKDGINFAKKNPGKRWFIKASGLAEGKGAIAVTSLNEAISAIKEMKRFGKSGRTYLIEEWLEGEEFSAFALCDGKNFKVVGYAQDHKRANDGDRGPNTGGMGCVSNPLVVNQNIKKQVKEIFRKTINGLKKEKRPYKGVLYLGGTVVGSEVYVIEFNARWGDPEAEVIIPSIQNDFYEVGMAILNGKINDLRLKIDEKVRVVVAATSRGYPVDYSGTKGKKIFGIEKLKKIEIKIFGAGIKENNGNYVVNGGRVLYLMAEGKGVLETQKKVYNAMSLINIEGNNLHYRKDIGWRDIQRL